MSSSKIKKIFKDAIAYKYGFIPIENEEVTENAIEFITDIHFDQKQIDFNSLRNYALHILSTSNFVKKSYNFKYPYIIVDEFQDTNKLEWEFIKQLANDSSLMCLADNNQQIFRFKGASKSRLNEFRREYNIGEETEYTLTNNYRNSSDINRLSKLILSMKNHYNAMIDKHFSLGDDIDIQTDFYSLQQQVYKQKWNILKESKQFKKIGILTKEKKDARRISEYLAKETENTLAIYNILITDGDDKIIKEDIILNTISLLEKIQRNDLIDLARKLDIVSQNSYNFEDRWKQVIDNDNGKIVLNIDAMHYNAKARKILEKILEIDLEKANFKSQFYDIINYFNDEIRGLDVSESLINKIYCQINNILSENQISIHDSINTYIQNRKQTFNYSNVVGDEGIYVMTLHKAKGKQFDVVYIFNFDDGIIPHYNEINNGSYLDSLNLFYVGVTRAKKKLKILCNTYTGKGRDKTPSRFLKPFLK